MFIAFKRTLKKLGGENVFPSYNKERLRKILRKSCNVLVKIQHYEVFNIGRSIKREHNYKFQLTQLKVECNVARLLASPLKIQLLCK